MIQCYTLPSRLNLNSEDDDLSYESNEEIDKLMEGYNQIKMKEVGLCKILSNFDNLMNYLGLSLSAAGVEFFAGFLSIHLKKHYKLSNSKIGMVWGAQSFFYLGGCFVLPKLLQRVPMKLSNFISFGVIGVGCMLMGTSKIFDIPEDLNVLIVGTSVLAVGVVPLYLYVLPIVFDTTSL